MEEAQDVAFAPAIATSTLRPTVFRAPLGSILFASSFLPARAARRCLYVPLWKCWVAHFLVGLSGLFLVPIILTVFFGGLSDFLREVENLFEQWQQYPLTTSATMLGIALLVEGLLLALAIVLTAWGSVAGDRLRDSLRHALRQVWLRTAHAVLVVFIVGVLVLWLQNANRHWRGGPPSLAQWPTAPAPLTLMPADPGYLEAQKQFDLEMDEYQVKKQAAIRVSREWRASRPWHLRNEGPLCLTAVVGGISWWLGAMLAAVAIRRTVAAEERSPLCLWCGYDLSMMPLASRCPECGKGVGDSLNDYAQPGVPWEKRHSRGMASAWLRTWKSWFGNVQELGRRLTLFAQSNDHRGYLLMHLPVIFFASAGGMLTAFFQAPSQGDEWAFVGGLFGIACVIGATLVCCGTASVVGWYTSLREKRNLLPAAMQIAAYGATYLTAWALFGAVLINSAMYLDKHDWFRAAHEITGLHRDLLLFFSCVLPNLLGGLLYLWMVARGTNGARYANQ